MVFLVRVEEGQWTWQLHSKALDRIIATCSVPTASEEACVDQIAIIKIGVPEAAIHNEHTGPITE